MMKLNRNKYTISPFHGSSNGQFFWVASFIVFVFLFSCKNKPAPPPQQEIVETPQQMAARLPDLIQRIINQGLEKGKLDDSTKFLQPVSLQWYYDSTNYAPKWSKEFQWLPIADSLTATIENARLYGLFPEDYHLQIIHSIRQKISSDSINRKDAVLWSKADILFTDALMQLVNHVKLGHLQKDSITLRKDSVLSNQFFTDQVNKVFAGNTISSTLDSLEPGIKGYQDLRAGIKWFLDSANFRNYTFIPLPAYDIVKFKVALKQRLIEDSLIDPTDVNPDSMKVSTALKKFQKNKKLTIDGKAGPETINALNLTDNEKFIRIAMTLDKFKLLPDSMPKKYLWVNLPAYYLELRDNDTIKINSKIVVGKPLTRTPELNSSISDMITYPQWNIPASIIEKEILPGLKKDPGYLAEKGYSLLDSKNQEVDPYFVDWSKYKKTIPYKVVQGSGDDNALGILKFNFPNKYAVYLHDTNQRYLFANKNRSLSHGCVRVQDWQKLASYILNNDSIYVVSRGKNAFTKTDSVTVWLSNKEKHYIPVRDRIPLFIRYFTCEAKDGKIVFYDDVYSEDQRLKEKYFQSK